MIRNPLRARVPSNAGQERGVTRRFGRAVYLILTVFFFMYLASTFAGPILSLQSDGIVTSDRFIVGAAYTAEIVAVDVRQGQNVVKGQRLLTLESFDIINSIAQLIQNLASLRAREQQLVGRMETAGTLLPIAAKRLQEATDTSRAVDRADASGAATFTFRSAVMREAYEAEREKASLSAEIDAVQNELRGIRNSISELESVLNRTRQSYSDGHVAARSSGIVGTKVPFPGQVVRAGDALLEVMTGSSYVLSYLPSGRLYEVAPGERVIITDGVRIVEGRIERIDAVADDLPPEFRSAFGKLERRQVMRISIREHPAFPYLSLVRAVRPWGTSHLFALLKNYLSSVAF
jgi:multidrug resistance efflux pump